MLLTTQYLDEADKLADRIVVIDTGKVIAEGTADELKQRVGGLRLEVHVADGSDPEEAARALTQMCEEPPSVEGALVKLRVTQETGTIMEAVRRLDAAGVEADDVAVKAPTLDDVFLALTGKEIPVEEDSTEHQEVAV